MDWSQLAGGRNARRARTLLFLIESRTAHLAERGRLASAPFLTDQALHERDLAFFDAFGHGREPPRPVRVHDLERYADHWAPLVPAPPQTRVALARAFAAKHPFTPAAAPRITAALGLGEQSVADAYEQAYGEPLGELFATDLAAGGRLRLLWSRFASRIEHLPPAAWTYVLSLTETVGTSMLALPIAVAGLGPLAGVVILVVLGLVNVVTAASMAEAVARSGSVRFGAAYLGKMVEGYIGRTGSIVLSVALFVFSFVLMVADNVGIGSTLGGLTGLPPELFVGVLFAAALFMITRGSLDATLAAAIVVAAINVSVLVIVMLISLPHVSVANLTRIELPFVGGRPFEPALVGSVFGVILSAFFGHLSISLCGREVLRRDPSGRSLVRGVVASQLTAIVLYSLWVLAIGGAVDAGALAREPGTALVPLAAVVGSSVSLLGSVYVLLGMGMGTIHYSLAMFNLARERLPSAPEPVVLLPRRRGTLMLTERRPPKDRPPARLAIMFLGLDHGPRFRIDVDLDGVRTRVEATAEDPWALVGENVLSPVMKQVPAIGERGISLTLDILEASPGSIRVRVTTSLRVEYSADWDALGATLADVLDAEETESATLAVLARSDAMTFEEVVAATGGDRAAARVAIESMLERGVVAESEGPAGHVFRAQMGGRRPRRLPDAVWLAMEGEADGATAPRGVAPASLSRSRRLFANPALRFAGGLFPVVAVFASAMWMLATGSGSFAGLIGFAGVVVVALLAGVYPVLLLASSRRRGEYLTAAKGRLRSHPVLLGAVYVFSVASVFLHGFLIWDDPVRRAGALVAGVGVLVLTVVVRKGGAFRPRLVVEVRAEDDEPADRAYFSITESGEPLAGRVELGYTDGRQIVHEAAAGQIVDYPACRTATFHLPPTSAEEVKVWLHHVTFTGDSFPLQARASLDVGGMPTTLTVGIHTTEVVAPLPPLATRSGVGPVVDVRIEPEGEA